MTEKGISSFSFPSIGLSDGSYERSGQERDDQEEPFSLLCDPKNNLTRMLGFKYGFEPIHEEAAVLFTDKTPDVFEDLFMTP